MRRGEIWTVAGGGRYTGKPRPVVIVQSDAFETTASVTVCGLTTTSDEAPLLRHAIEPSPGNGLRERSHLMVDKLTTVSRADLGRQIGLLAGEDLTRLDRLIIVFLGLAGPELAEP